MLYLPYAKKPFRYYQKISIPLHYYIYWGKYETETSALFIDTLEDSHTEQDFEPDEEDEPFFIDSTWFGDIDVDNDLKNYKKKTSEEEYGR